MGLLVMVVMILVPLPLAALMFTLLVSPLSRLLLTLLRKLVFRRLAMARVLGRVLKQLSLSSVAHPLGLLIKMLGRVVEVCIMLLQDRFPTSSRRTVLRSSPDRR